MLDLETMGTQPGALLLSIGAVRFNPNDTSYVLDREAQFQKFHVGIEPTSAEAYGLTVEVNTALWWMHDDQQAARASLAALEQTDLATALEGFAQWAQLEPFDAIWGNSASFDCGLLSAAYAKVGMERPWKFWQERCYRTLKGLAPEVKVPELEGVPHNALYDATRQALHLQAIYRAYGVR